MENINNSYFDGHYKDIWRSIIPAKLSEKEVEFMLQYFGLGPGSKVLDLMCGYGRHSLGLAEKGIEVTAVDNLDEYITEIKQKAGEKQLPVKAEKTDVLRFTTNDTFDLAICMGNSFNFFSAGEINQLLSMIFARLKAGGSLLINSWSLAEIAIKSFTEKSSSEIYGLKCLSESQYLFHPTRIETETTIIAADGTAETKTAIDYIYSVAEMETLFNENGFVLKEIYSIPGQKKFKLGEPRAYIIAQKV